MGGLNRARFDHAREHRSPVSADDSRIREVLLHQSSRRAPALSVINFQADKICVGSRHGGIEQEQPATAANIQFHRQIVAKELIPAQVSTDFGHRLKPRFDRFNGRGLHE